MSFIGTIDQINAETLKYAPGILQGVIAVEAAAKGLPGQTKSELVVNTILAGATAAQAIPVPQVQGIAALVALFVAILNAAGLFRHKAAPEPVK